jgi:hypothetical protein
LRIERGITAKERSEFRVKEINAFFEIGGFAESGRG